MHPTLPIGPLAVPRGATLTDPFAAHPGLAARGLGAQYVTTIFAGRPQRHDKSIPNRRPLCQAVPKTVTIGPLRFRDTPLDSPAMDPSERFTELLPCGCGYEQGSWSYCAQHVPSAFHSQHTAYMPECDRCQDLLQEAREVASEEPWNDR